jgi:hypothetical protein
MSNVGGETVKIVPFPIRPINDETGQKGGYQMAKLKSKINIIFWGIGSRVTLLKKTNLVLIFVLHHQTCCLLMHSFFLGL